MNQKSYQALIKMLTGFGVATSDMKELLLTFEEGLIGVSDEAVVETTERFRKGEIARQSTRYRPTEAEFVSEARKVDEVLAIKARPRLAPPAYRPGPLAPYQVTANRLRAENAHLPVLFEDVSYERWRQLSASKQIPVGAKWVAGLATVYGPEPKAEQAAA